MPAETATLSAYHPPVEISVTVKATTNDEMSSKLADLAALFGGKGQTAIANKDAAATAARVAGTTATTSVPATAGKSAAQIKKEQAAAADAVAKKAADDAAKAAASDGAGDEDPFGEGTDEEPGELTMDDLRNILTELRDAQPSKPSIVADIIKAHGGNGTAKIANVKPEAYRAVWDAAKAAMPAAA